jgi:hypothetical protein
MDASFGPFPAAKADPSPEPETNSEKPGGAD